MLLASLTTANVILAMSVVTPFGRALHTGLAVFFGLATLAMVIHDSAVIAARIVVKEMNKK